MGTKRTSRSQRANANVAPDQMKLTARQAERLSSMTGVSVADLKGATIADLTEQLKWRIDPNLLLKTPIAASSVSSLSKGRGAGCSR
jgi:hypothetical protein